MPEFSPQFLAEVTGGRWTTVPAKAPTGAGIDTRTLRAGDLFVALRTAKRDGHDFLAEARRAGAAAALVATARADESLPQLVVADPLSALQAIALAHRRTFRGPVVGISGSAGKTSTKDLLALLLGGTTSGVVATEGNLNNTLGVPLTLLRLDPARHTFAVVEAGISEPGEMAVLARMIEPDVSLITLVAAAHTEALGGLEGVAREKAVLPAATRASGVAVFPRSVLEYAAFRALGVRTMTVERADAIRPAEPPQDKVYFTVTHRGMETAVALAYGAPPPLVFTLRRVSDGQAQNAALAICTALWLGVTPAQISERLGGWTPAKLRGEIREQGGRLRYLDCYNANPASMADALATFAEIAPAEAPRLYLLGCMAELGPESPGYHRALGRSLPWRAGDRVLVLGDEAAEVVAGAQERFGAAADVHAVTDRAAMAAALAEWNGPAFLKGSRRYALEDVLERAAGPVPTC